MSLIKKMPVFDRKFSKTIFLLCVMDEIGIALARFELELDRKNYSNGHGSHFRFLYVRCYRQDFMLS